MGGTGSCAAIRIIFGGVIRSWYTSLNIKFGANRMFYVLKNPVHPFDLYGRYRILLTDEDNFWCCYKELINKPKYQIWYESDFPCAQDPGIPVWFIWEVPDPVDRYFFIFNTDRRMGNRNLFAKFEVHTSLRSEAIVITTD